MVTIASTHFIWTTELTELFPHLALCLETENSTPSDDHPGKQNERPALFTLFMLIIYHLFSFINACKTDIAVHVLCNVLF